MATKALRPLRFPRISISPLAFKRNFSFAPSARISDFVSGNRSMGSDILKPLPPPMTKIEVRPVPDH
jgi:hypothetical protein